MTSNISFIFYIHKLVKKFGTKVPVMDQSLLKTDCLIEFVSRLTQYTTRSCGSNGFCDRCLLCPCAIINELALYELVIKFFGLP
jgi:hypothetical protein